MLRKGSVTQIYVSEHLEFRSQFSRESASYILLRMCSMDNFELSTSVVTSLE